MRIARLLWRLGGILMLTFSPWAQTLPARETQDVINISVTIASDHVQFRTPGAPLEWRLEIVDPQGHFVFDSGAVNGKTIDWPLVDGQDQPVKSGLYQYTLTIRTPGVEPRIQRGYVQLDRMRSLYEIRALASDLSDTGVAIDVVESGLDPGGIGAADAPRDALPRSFGTVQLQGTSYLGGTGTTGFITKWADGPGGVVGDAQMSEYAGALTIGNGSFKGNLHIFGSAGSDVFAGMGPNLVTGPAFNYGYGGGSFGRSAGFFNVRPDASAVAPNPSLRFMTANVERMIVTNTGRVGIGTSAPSAQLHVAKSGGIAVYADSDSNPIGQGFGVYGTSSGGTGVFGYSAVWRGVYGASTSGVGVLGYSATGSAGSFQGDVVVTGDLSVGGTLSKGGGAFRIDHPLDPGRKYLLHSFVESPDMLNVYNANVVLDARGEAVVVLPAWFEALNRDFRYQLTPLGAPGPNLYIAAEIADNRFTIAGGTPGGKVSWQVTGIRQDAWANAHRIPVEQNKTDADRVPPYLPGGVVRRDR